MRGVLLRSGRSEHFTALGETGQPVYRAALQIREAIRRKYPEHPELIEHLAIPQSDEQGRTIDWYSDRPGDVIPWSSATEEERAPARVQLEMLQSKINALSNTLLGLDANGQPSATARKAAEGDNAVFGKLLTCVVPFPDENFVYLVDGRPVLTFWGFIHAGAERSRQPLHCLYPRTAPIAEPVAAPLAPPAAPIAPAAAAAVPPVAAVTRLPWWRNLRWILPLLLMLALLLLLLFGLRGCIPGVNLSGPGFPDLGRNTSVPVNHQGQVTTQSSNLVGAANGATGATAPDPAASTGDPASLSGDPADAGGAAPQGDSQAPADSADTPAQGNPETPPAPEQQPAPEQTPDAPPPGEAEASTPENTQPAPPQLADEQAQTGNPPPQPDDLSIPPNAADGNADFLNGKWAGAGIQEAGTGKPLRLKYDFQNGKGQATVTRPDKVQCHAPVAAAMQGGLLSINSSGQAACADGSSYDLPQVGCKAKANGAADCNANYGAKGFDIQMKKAG
ncbi:MAG: SrfA family protein [Candidatus Pseudomonas phytovorans]|uniref:SrfA family protein n=1 Tax=Candidatus Pseudomonas phytovorans TaxID=3121377 RepID=A0AAJ6BC46_9PSED|nr:SrfA family protein [Pseudomonas sp.]WEK30847.1 MAG: SrfA family protein [Pseudomonas sp.]